MRERKHTHANKRPSVYSVLHRSNAMTLLCATCCS